jgi:hypothetical protein
LIDKIARNLGETGSVSHEIVQDRFDAVNDEMEKWMEVTK